MWEVTGPISEELQEAIRSHLKYNCQFTFEGPFRLTGEPAPFYGAALLCQLALLPSSSYKNARKTKVLDTEATFYFLFRTVDADEVLIRLTGGEGDVLLAKRWLGLDLHDDAQRLKYARFYYAFALTERPPQFRNVPCNISDLRFDKPVTEQRIWGIYGRRGDSWTRKDWMCGSISSGAEPSGPSAIAPICRCSLAISCSTST